jgi:hypothetical protein
MLNKKRIGSSRTKRLKKVVRALLFHALFTLILFSLFLGLLALLSRLPAFSIRTVTVRGTVLLSSDEIKAATSDVLAGSYYHLFAKRNSFIYPRKSIERHLLDAFKNAKTVTVERRGWTTVNVSVKEREPAGVWCGKTPRPSGLEEELVSEPCYYLDSNGYVYAKAPTFTGSVFFTYYSDLSSEPIGQYVLPPGSFAKLAGYLAALKIAGVTPRSIGLMDGHDIAVGLPDNSQVLFTDSTDPEKLGNDLKTVLDSSEFKTELAAAPLGLDYIDFRFGGKIFYKFR